MTVTVPKTMVAELYALLADKINEHQKPDISPWGFSDSGAIEKLFSLLPPVSRTLVSTLVEQRLNTNDIGKQLGWTFSKVNGALSPVSKAAAEVGKTPVILRAEGILLLDPFFEAVLLQLRSEEQSRMASAPAEHK